MKKTLAKVRLIPWVESVEVLDGNAVKVTLKPLYKWALGPLSGRWGTRCVGSSEDSDRVLVFRSVTCAQLQLARKYIRYSGSRDDYLVSVQNGTVVPDFKLQQEKGYAWMMESFQRHAQSLTLLQIIADHLDQLTKLTYPTHETRLEHIEQCKSIIQGMIISTKARGIR